MHTAIATIAILLASNCSVGKLNLWGNAVPGSEGMCKAVDVALHGPWASCWRSAVHSLKFTLPLMFSHVPTAGRFPASGLAAQ